MPMGVRLLAVLTATVFTLGGCGLMWEPPPKTPFSDLSVTEMVSTAERQVKDAEFVTVKGKGKDGGQTITFDVRFAPKSASGKVVLDGQTLMLLSVGGKTYAKADAAFYRSSKLFSGSADEQKILRLMAGQWLDVRAWELGELGDFVSRFGFFADLSTPDGKITRRPAQKVNGVVCIPLRDKGGTLYIDKRDGKPILLTTDGRYTFSYAPVAESKPPSPADVLTRSELKAAFR